MLIDSAFLCMVGQCGSLIDLREALAGLGKPEVLCAGVQMLSGLLIPQTRKP